MIRDYGVLAVEDTADAAEIALDVYEDLLKISYFSENFGGPHFLGEEDIAFIDNWEVENYRRMISKGSGREDLWNKRSASSPAEPRVSARALPERLCRTRQMSLLPI